MGERKREHLDPGNVITLSGLGAPAGEGDFELPWEERNFCVRQVLDRAPHVRRSHGGECKPLYDKALDHCTSYNFPKADHYIELVDICLRHGISATMKSAFQQARARLAEEERIHTTPPWEEDW